MIDHRDETDCNAMQCKYGFGHTDEGRKEEKEEKEGRKGRKKGRKKREEERKKGEVDFVLCMGYLV